MPSVWDLRAQLYDVCEGSQLRRAPYKAALFREMAGRVLFVAVGTGVDIPQFPPDREIVGIDISEEMLRRAEARQKRYRGNLRLVRMDAMHLAFPDASFDTVVTSCTMCSVPDAVAALRELYRVLRPDGRLLMFEHVRSRNSLLAWTLDLMTVWTRWFGTEMNRDTVAAVSAAGFRITQIDSVYLDIILTIRAVKREPALLTDGPPLAPIPAIVPRESHWSAVASNTTAGPRCTRCHARGRRSLALIGVRGRMRIPASVDGEGPYDSRCPKPVAKET